MNIMKEYLKEFLTELSGVRRVSENTVKSYSRDLSQYLLFCEEKKITGPHLISEKKVKLYLVWISKFDYKKTTISRKLSAIRTFHNFLMKMEYCSDNPAKKISNPKTGRTLPDIIHLDNYKNIFKLVDEEQNKGNALRIKTIFEILYGGALRVSELCGLNVRDLDLKAGTLRVLGKGSKQRIVPLGHNSVALIKEYLKTRTKLTSGSPLIETVRGNRIYPRMVQRIVSKYLSKVSDINKRSPHVLRHAAATHMLDKGADIIAVKEILGHENLSTTQIYTHVSVERLKKSYKTAHPKS